MKIKTLTINAMDSNHDKNTRYEARVTFASAPIPMIIDLDKSQADKIAEILTE